MRGRIDDKRAIAEIEALPAESQPQLAGIVELGEASVAQRSE
jgi:hypothetical protein